MTHALAVVHDTETQAVAIQRQSELSPMTFDQVVQMGDQLVRTGFLPEHVKTGAQAAAIILTGKELGMPPMRALRSLQMVKGKVVENADSQLARFKTAGGRADWRRLDDRAAVLFLRHPNGDEHEESFTFEDAERAGLTKPSFKGEPSMFTKYPRAMLRSRAITAALKSVGWEGGVGAYDPEEALAFTPSAPATVRVVDDEPQSRQVETQASSSIDERAPLDNAPAGEEAACPKCGGRMWDNSTTKTNPKAPDFKCRDKSCDGVFWPGQWPPKPDATQEQRLMIVDLMSKATLTDKARQKITAELADTAKPLSTVRASEIIGKLHDKLPEPTTVASGPPALDAYDDLRPLPF
jgi:hypothetical protein